MNTVTNTRDAGKFLEALEQAQLERGEFRRLVAGGRGVDAEEDERVAVEPGVAQVLWSPRITPAKMDAVVIFMKFRSCAPRRP